MWGPADVETHFKPQVKITANMGANQPPSFSPQQSGELFLGSYKEPGINAPCEIPTQRITLKINDNEKTKIRKKKEEARRSGFVVQEIQD